MRQFIDYLKCYVKLNDEDIVLLQQNIEVKEYFAQDMVFESGSISHEIYFVLQGFLRMFYWIDGVDKTAFFYPEGVFVCAGNSYTNRVPALENFQAIEKTKLCVLTRSRVEFLIKEIPQLEEIARVAMENELIASQNLISSFVTRSPEERYIDLLKSDRTLLQRAPQRYIASYLGVSPETLSRIRRRIYLKGIS